jgi:uncharacterized protein (DUF885 family)
MRLHFGLTLSATLLFAASLFAQVPAEKGEQSPGSLQPANQRKSKPVNNWDAYVARFLPAYFEVEPDAAMSAGSHAYDSVLLVPTAPARRAQLAFATKELVAMQKMGNGLLSPSAIMDKAILTAELEATLFYLNTLQSWVWNPSQYNACAAFSEILANPTLARPAKIRDLAIRLRAVPAYYQAAQSNISNPTKEHTALAIAQNTGGMVVFAELKDSLLLGNLTPEALAKAKEDCDKATAAVMGYVAFLKGIDTSKARSFRLGAALYEAKFSHAIQTGATAQTAYASALARKRYLHAKMYERAKQLAPAGVGAGSDTLAFIQSVINTIAQNHCKPQDFQEEIRAQIPALAAFVTKKDLLYQDPSKPLVVRKEPAYMAGVAGASISAPGPLEKGGNTYYNVGSLAAMSAAEQESFLREYNNYTLQILNIHEAIPGHYTQLVYANRSPSLVKSIFGNGAMIEGWAVFSELMMLENGYGNDDPAMWLMYYKWNLRTVCNTILDYSIHVLNMTKPQALDLLQNQAFQTEAEANGKWKRATLSSVQLCSYFTGFDAILQLRNAYKKENPKTYTPKVFNEAFLSYGSAPVSLIAGQMLAKP